jgi:Tfp pilus assembly protein PilO
MANLRAARRNLYAIGVILMVVDVIALVILLSPVGAISATRQEEFQHLRQEVQAKTRAVVPPDQVQERVNEARKQIAQFVEERIPAQPSDLSVELGKLASDAGVKLSTVRYDELDSEIPNLRHYRISAAITGDYLQEVKFINSLERSKHFYVINSVNLGELQQGAVRLGITLDTYLKELE